MKPDPLYSNYLAKWSKLYHDANYNKGLAAFFLRKSHALCESRFGSTDYFPTVLEVGAGSGVHLQYVTHSFDKYWITDTNEEMLRRIEKNNSLTADNLIFKLEDASNLTFCDNYFDRLIATHVLEHLANPHLVLREWNRVVRPGGIISVVLPCDPGIAWRIGRHLGSRTKYIKAGVEYDYWMAREHINPIGNLTAFIKYHFEKIEETFYPCWFPSLDLNLFYVCHLTVCK